VERLDVATVTRRRQAEPSSFGASTWARRLAIAPSCNLRLTRAEPRALALGLAPVALWNVGGALTIERRGFRFLVKRRTATRCASTTRRADRTQAA
jgi:hypothetical protein